MGTGFLAWRPYRRPGGRAYAGAKNRLFCPKPRYIETQEEHHRNVTFIEESKRPLDKHGIVHNPKYLP